MHATAPCSAHALAQARPTMSYIYIPLVYKILQPCVSGIPYTVAASDEEVPIVTIKWEHQKPLMAERSLYWTVTALAWKHLSRVMTFGSAAAGDLTTEQSAVSSSSPQSWQAVEEKLCPVLWGYKYSHLYLHVDCTALCCCTPFMFYLFYSAPLVLLYLFQEAVRNLVADWHSGHL